ncbi:MAG TPA: cohesin domain-containing protein [Vicinamibacteria bacterium]
MILIVAGLAASGCAAKWAYRQGQSEARKGNWDLAVARLTKALQKDPSNIGYKIALENARIQASRYHQDQARKALAADDLDKGAEELKIAADYDPSNKAAADELAGVKDRLLKRDQEKRRLSDFESMRARVQASRPGVPVLSPRSTAPIKLHFPDTSLQKVLETLGKLAGVNVLFDFDYRDKRVDVDLSGLTFQEALDRLTFTNRLFYKVLDQNTIIIVPESPAKRRVYDEVLLQTFYLQNAETKDVEAIIKQMLGTTAKVASNPTLGSVTIIGTIDQLALAERVVGANDKARGEVIVDVEILEINRNKAKQYGIELSNYTVSSTFSPAGNDVSGGLTTVRAHLLSSLNLADFIVQIPSTLLARFFQTDSSVRILAAPRLRAAEGKPTKLSIGTEVPVPVTTFTATQPGVTTFAPATSFNYRNVGVNLTITPRVNASGEIALELSAEFSQVGDSRNVGTGQNPINVPTFLSRKIEGVLRVRDGETNLIGGLVQSRDAESFKGALGLPSIPILNRIFPSADKQRDDTEILISLTPHLVRAPRLIDEDLASLYVGSAEQVRVPSVRPPLFGQPEEPPLAPVPIPGPTPPPSPPPPPEATPPAETTPPARPAPPGTVMEPSGAPSVPAGERRGVTAAISPAEASLRVGETANVSVVLLNVQDLVGMEMVVSYDPALLEAVDVGTGPLLTLDGAAVGVERNIEPGRARAKFSRATGASGSGMVATVTFRALRQGAGAVTVDSLSIVTVTGAQQLGVATPVRVVVSP